MLHAPEQCTDAPAPGSMLLSRGRGRASSGPPQEAAVFSLCLLRGALALLPKGQPLALRPWPWLPRGPVALLLLGQLLERGGITALPRSPAAQDDSAPKQLIFMVPSRSLCAHLGFICPLWDHSFFPPSTLGPSHPAQLSESLFLLKPRHLHLQENSDKTHIHQGTKPPNSMKRYVTGN